MPHTHYAFTVGKDGLVKYWDADRWELLLTLEGHQAEVQTCISAGHAARHMYCPGYLAVVSCRLRLPAVCQFSSCPGFIVGMPLPKSSACCTPRFPQVLCLLRRYGAWR